jgi:hypothetical protein
VTASVDRHGLRQIIAGLSEGVILVEPDQTIAGANEAALATHGAGTLDELRRRSTRTAKASGCATETTWRRNSIDLYATDVRRCA